MSPKKAWSRLKRAESAYVANIREALTERQGPRSDVLTQASNRDGATFPESPRWDRGEIEVSAVDGALSVEQLIPRAFHRSAVDRDTARYLSVALLVQGEYFPVATPSHANELHVSICASADTRVDDHRQWWGRPERVTLAQVAAKTDVRPQEGGE